MNMPQSLPNLPPFAVKLRLSDAIVEGSSVPRNGILLATFAFIFLSKRVIMKGGMKRERTHTGFSNSSVDVPHASVLAHR